MDVLQKIPVFLCVLAITYAFPLEHFLVPELADCVNSLSRFANTTVPEASVSVLDIKERENDGQPTDVDMAMDYAGTKVPRQERPEDVQLYCIQQFVLKEDMVRWENYNITQTEIDFVHGLLETMMKPTGVKHSRSKRQSITPPTGRRTRREYRRLSDGERNAFHTVLQQMKTVRGGNTKINGKVSLPYWDSTLDFDMINPVNTILFSPAFFGNGDGQVTTGPFANWKTPFGPLTRNIGAGSTLFTKANIRSIMTRCHTREITRPTALTDFEGFHGGPHVWVNGQMSDLNAAAHDPVFFLHHAFIDYVWELFRVHQVRDCRVDPSSDYPQVTGHHSYIRPMDGFSGYRNIDGYRSYWTQNWYNYESSPTCPNCNSQYLRCDPARGVCVSIERIQRMHVLSAAANKEGVSHARADVAMLNLNAIFDAPPAEPRTQEGQARMSRMEVASRRRLYHSIIGRLT